MKARATRKSIKLSKKPVVPLPFLWMTLDTGDATDQLAGVIENLKAQGFTQVTSVPWVFGLQPGFIVLYGK